MSKINDLDTANHIIASACDAVCLTDKECVDDPYALPDEIRMMAARWREAGNGWSEANKATAAAESRITALEAPAVELAGLLNEAAGTYETLRCDTSKFRAALSSPLLAEIRAKEGV
jgi:hypothetical protein